MNDCQQSSSRFVFSYINPDTDGVCCSLAYAEWAERVKGEKYTPLLWGVADAATLTALARYGVEVPAVVDRLPPECHVVLVDTHHLAQLPSHLDPQQVLEIIDHHPHGDVDAFSNAQLQNESVGAAATLIAERFDAAGLLPSPPVAGLLASAIVCNTLNLEAPSVSDRDRKALDRLRTATEFPASFTSELLATLGQSPERFDTATLLATNAKQFHFGSPLDSRVVIVQIECSEPARVVGRDDLLNSIELLAREQGADHCFVSVVGLTDGSTTVVCPAADTRALLERTVDLTFVGNVSWVPRLLLRKTDYVPRLGAHLADQDCPADTP
ncbi:DHH family phosphoesterase [Streptomyces sp. NPDC058685]|uniref:DHH family phosphoesterase n=1 Tax=Streptomyces sp. NPDC058685 TaxID=3346598 RepID=UPI00366102E6